MICKHCGKQINDNSEYCSFCGSKVLHVPPVFTMTGLKTDVATDVVRSYTEWGFYNNPDAELDPETGKKPEYGFDALDALPDENHLKWARDFIEADQIAEEYTIPQEEADSSDDEDNDADTDGTYGDSDEPAAPKKRIPGPVIVIALVLLAAAIAVGAYFLFEKNKSYEADLSAMMAEPKVIGYDGYGEMALMPQIDAAKEDEWLRTVSFDEDRESFKEVLDTARYTPDKTKDLSNGDTVTITITYDQDLAAEKELKIKAETMTYEVKGLEIGKDLAYDPDAYHAYYDDFVLPESDRVYLTTEDVAYSTNGSADMTQQAINEIYARHGWIFGNEHYDKLFRSFEWYVPMYEPEKFDDSWLNDYEKTNLSLLTQYRNELRKAAEEAAKKAEEEKAKAEAAKKATDKDEDKDND